MILTIIIVIFGYILIRFFISLNKDNNELQGQTLDGKFSVIVNMINDVAFDGGGSVTTLDKNAFNLYAEGQNQIIKFLYATGHLTITWRYKYFQKEVIHEIQFNYVRNLSLFEQQKIAKQMIREMTNIVQEHKNSVIEGI